MQSTSIVNFVYFGFCVRYLQDTPAGRLVHGEHLLHDNLKRFFKHLERLGLVVTLRASDELATIRDELAAKPEDHKLTTDEARRLRQEINAVRRTLEAEAEGHAAYVVTEKRFDLEKLLTNVAGLMPKGTFAGLPDIAKTDFEEAGRCIAFERATAAAFHSLRGTEAVLRTLYTETVKQKRVSPLNWAPMLIDLRKRRTKPPEPVLDELNNIRRHYRNPTQHPEKVYELDEAQDLFGQSIAVTGRMVQWLEGRRKKRKK